MIDQFINFVIRPPRAEYDPNQYLWEEEFTLAGKGYRRQDLELQNGRGHKLKCSHYFPSTFPEGISLPCVIYCHGNSGCRADANDVAVILLPSNITVFALDFSGSGLSDGDYVSLGWHEKDDLKTVVTFLRSNPKISLIGLWGRSMGAVTSLLYGAEDPSIAGMVLDSAFSNLFDLMMELADVYKIRLPKFTVKMGVQFMRRVIQKRAKFDIMDLNCLQVAPRTYIPALFAHAADDVFIQPHHSDRIYQCYAGDKNIIKFKGDHNSHRPQFYYDSVSIFFYNVLRPPKLSSASSIIEKFCHTGGLKDAGAMNMSSASSVIEKFCHAGSLKDAGAMNMRSMSTMSAASSSSAPPCSSEASVPIPTLISELLSEMGDSAEAMDITNGQVEECCSYSSSDGENWGRCSPAGQVSDESPHQTTTPITRSQMSFRALVMPLRNMRCRSNNDALKEKKNKKTRKKNTSIHRRSMHPKLVNLDRLSQRFRSCMLGHVREK